MLKLFVSSKKTATPATLDAPHNSVSGPMVRRGLHLSCLPRTEQRPEVYEELDNLQAVATVTGADADEPVSLWGPVKTWHQGAQILRERAAGDSVQVCQALTCNHASCASS